jgi:type IV pilus assembly protein PilC
VPKFRFIAMDAKGQETEGVLEAENQNRLIGLLREKGLFPTKVEEMGKKAAAGPAKPGAAAQPKGGLSAELKMPKFLSALFAPRVSAKQLTIFTRQLATLLDAGLPLLRGLHILQRQEAHPTLKAAITGMAESVEGGSTFAEAMAQQNKVFDKFFVNMVRAGEAGGALETVLVRMAEFMEKGQRIKNKIKGAMVYPVVVLVMALGILSFMLLVIIPKFAEIFKDLLGSADELPPLTKVVMGISKIFTDHGVLALVIIGVIVVVIRAMSATKRGRYLLDVLKLKAPVFGGLTRMGAISTFARTLGTLLTGGVPMLQALSIVKDVAGNLVISTAIGQVHDAVKEGESMVTPLDASKVFPGMVIGMVQVGEETGALPDMLMKIADTYDDEVDTAVDAMTSVIEPILIIFLAVVVGTIVIAMFMPMISIITKMSG